MCLWIPPEYQGKQPRTKRCWKILSFEDDDWYTPYQALLANRRMRAEGRKEVGGSSSWPALYGGVIHCFRNKRSAQLYLNQSLPIGKFAIWEARGIGKAVGMNLWEVAYKEIELVDDPLLWEM